MSKLEPKQRSREQQKPIDVVRNAWKAGTMVPSFNATFPPMIEPIVRAVAAGNMHGALLGRAKGKDKPASRLDIDLVERLSAAANAPLVIHGGSGIDIDNLLAAFKLGVAKINVAKTLRLCYTRALARSEAVSAAQKALYEQTRRLIDAYHIAGSAGIVTEDPLRNS